MVGFWVHLGKPDFGAQDYHWRHREKTTLLIPLTLLISACGPKPTEEQACAYWTDCACWRNMDIEWIWNNRRHSISSEEETDEEDQTASFLLRWLMIFYLYFSDGTWNPLYTRWEWFTYHRTRGQRGWNLYPDFWEKFYCIFSSEIEVGEFWNDSLLWRSRLSCCRRRSWYDVAMLC